MSLLPPAPLLPETIVPGDSDHIEQIHHILNNLADFVGEDSQGTLAARPGVGAAGVRYWATDVRRAYRSDGVDWWPLDHGNGAINGADYGMTGVNTLDVTSRLQDLISDAELDNRAAFIPPVDRPQGYHKVTGSVNLEAVNEYVGVHILSLGGSGRNGPFQFNGGTEIVNPVNNLPIFSMDASAQSHDAAPLYLENLTLYGFGLNYKGGGQGGGIQARGCCFFAGGAPQAIRASDTFWWRFYDSSFVSATSADPAIRMVGEAPIVNENISYLFHFESCIFSNGGIRYEQNVNYAPNASPGMWTVINVDTENLADGSAFVEIVRGGGVTDQPTLFGLTMEAIRHFDPTGATRVPILKSGAGCRIQGVLLGECIYYGAAIVSDGNVPVGIIVRNPARDDPVATNSAGTKLDMLGHKQIAGSDTYLGSSGTPDLLGFSARRATDTYDRWGVNSDGEHFFGDGTAAPLRTIFPPHAGTPEGAVTATPGALCPDKTNGELYIKKTGSGNTGWKLVTHA